MDCVRDPYPQWRKSPLSEPVEREHVLLPGAEDFPTLGIQFVRVMFAHTEFERQFGSLQDEITNAYGFGEHRPNQWPPKNRPANMVDLIEKHLGKGLPQTQQIEQLLTDAIEPCQQRDFLVHGHWWNFDRRTETVTVRGASRSKERPDDPPEQRDYTASDIHALAERFADLEAELYKLRRSLFSLLAADGLRREASQGAVADADDKAKKVADDNRIDLREPFELAYWSRKFGVSREQLAEAIQKVGTNVQDVAIALDKMVDLKINPSSRTKGGTVAVLGLCVLMIGVILLVWHP
jgi:Protein of unknown function (DUF3606)